MKVIGFGVVVVILGSISVPASAQAAARPAAGQQNVRTAPGAAKEQGPVVDAAKALLKEYQTVMKEKKGVGLREKADYFGEKKPDGVTAESVLAVIEKPIPGTGDP